MHGVIAKEPSDPRHSGSLVAFTSAARRGLNHFLLRAAAAGRPRRILLPAYIGITDREGSGLLDPVEEAGFSYQFYPVDGELSPAAGTDDVLSSDPTAIFCIVHFFGWRARGVEAFAERCLREERLLIEDCAHVLHGIAGAPGELGDATIWSVHKTLPVPTGGLLRIRGELPDLNDEDRMDRDVLEIVARTDALRVADRRRRNFDRLYRRLEGCGCELRWKPGPDVPLNLPLLVPVGVDRFDLYKRLLRKEVGVVALYYRLVAAIDLAVHQTSDDLMRRILNLPIHQDLADADVDRIADVFLQELGS